MNGFKEVNGIFYKDSGEMVISRAGFELATHFEGSFLKAYADPVGVWTIGRGRIFHSDGTPVKEGDTCTTEECGQWLLEDIEKDGSHFVRAWIKQPLLAHQFSALASFTFNRGSGRFHEHIVGMVNSGKLIEAADYLLTYDWAIDKQKKTVHLAGLLRRRKAERYMFLGRDWEIYKT